MSKISEADFEILSNINTQPGPNAGRSIDPTKPGPDDTAKSPEPQDVREAWYYIKRALAPYMEDKLSAAFGTIEAALAQSDAQPVAWRYRPKGSFTWFVAFELGSWNNSNYEIEPLYTAPPRPDASGLIEAAKIAEGIEKNCLMNAEVHRPPYKGVNLDIADQHEIGAAIAHQIATAIRSRAADRSAHGEVIPDCPTEGIAARQGNGA